MVRFAKQVPVQMINEENKAEEVIASQAMNTVTVAAIWEAALMAGLPVAVWRLPESQVIRLIVSENRVPLTVTPDLEKLPSGFLIARFDPKEESALFLEGSLSLSFPVGNPVIGWEDLQEGAESFTSPWLEQIEAVVAKNIAGAALTSDVLSERRADGASERYKQIVRLAADKVKAGELFKVVLSRTKEFELTSGFNVVNAFLQLERAYGSAFVSMVSLPDTNEIWLGASPELLVGVRQKRYFETVALAGTQSAAGDDGLPKPRSNVLWSEKEIEEQALVSRYIIECFKRIRLREYVETGPKSAKAGNLYHLKSDFEVDLDRVNFPELGSVMLRLLHPTSAVCGMPREDAVSLIARLEGYDRSFYSGYWGPVNVDGDSNLFVNLRTLRIKGRLMTLFAGAGITAESDPEEEWKETELKCETLLSVIHPNYKNLNFLNPYT